MTMLGVRQGLKKHVQNPMDGSKPSKKKKNLTSKLLSAYRSIKIKASSASNKNQIKTTSK